MLKRFSVSVILVMLVFVTVLPSKTLAMTTTVQTVKNPTDVSTESSPTLLIIFTEVVTYFAGYMFVDATELGQGWQHVYWVTSGVILTIAQYADGTEEVIDEEPFEEWEYVGLEQRSTDPNVDSINPVVPVI